MNLRGIAVVLISLGFAVSGSVASAGWQDKLKGWVDSAKEGAGSSGTESGGSGASSLTEGEAGSGLREALQVGTQRAIQMLGRDGGYLDDPQVRIPMPGALRTVEKGLRAVRQDALADEFIETMNRAAEKAVPQAADIFGNAIRDMTVQDAHGILTGPDDAATQYFRSRTGSDLTAAMLPIVKDATNRAGVTASYKRMTAGAGSGMLGGLVSGSDVDLDQYITDKTIDGLFLKIAAEEKNIRTNPVARSSDLLKKVFGAVAR